MMRAINIGILKLIFGVWTLVGLLFTLSHSKSQTPTGRTLWAAEALGRGFGDAYLWALLTVAALWLSRAFPLERGRWKAHAVVHAVVGLALTGARLAGWYGIVEVTGGSRRSLLEFFYLFFAENFVTFWFIVGVLHAFEYARRLHERDLAAERLQKELATAQLHVLKTQLHPHFLFNTLHAISSLMYTDVRAADLMLSQLADLLRSSLQAFTVQQVPLRQELEFLIPYLQIEQARLGNRLHLEMEVDPGLDLALVPHMILQPLVENAVRHAIAPRQSGGCLQIQITGRDDRLRLVVSDDGPGAAHPLASKGQGIGISNTRARLATLYRDAHRFEIRSEPEGFTVLVEIPLELASEPVEAPVFV